MTSKISDHEISLEPYFSGQKLYGDDFSPEEIKEWISDERKAYGQLVSTEVDEYTYGYHTLNTRHGFRHLPNQKFSHALGLGAACGDEFLPIASRIDQLTIIDSVPEFALAENVALASANYLEPQPGGDFGLGDNQVDLITSFGVLHHLPNVTHVLQECFRCLADGGFMLIREPIVSMGNWTIPRPGLTKRERGIPKDILLEIIRECGFTIKNQSLCIFSLVPRLSKILRIAPYNNRLLTLVDSSLCKAWPAPIRYHATKAVHKIRPTCLFAVLSK